MLGKIIDRWMLEDIATLKCQDPKSENYGAHAVKFDGKVFQCYARRQYGTFYYGQKIDGRPVGKDRFDNELSRAQEMEGEQA